MKIKLILLILLIIGITAAAYVYFFVWNKKHPDFRELPADIFMNAEQLYSDFARQADSASQEYNGKILQIHGDITRIEKVDSLTIAVFVYNEGMFGDEGIRCTFLTPVGDSLSTDDNLIGQDIKGFCSGFNETDVILEKCSLVEN